MTHGGHKDSTLKKAREAGVNHAIMNPAVSGARLPKCSNGKSYNSALWNEHGLNSLLPKEVGNQQLRARQIQLL